ncbi:biotin carboxylase N-terminal domain-containing protein [Desulfohalovibrio reitneri]|uniref:biotin carboxylase N-terminal domain-containing protein n=1 Tax=Desulfohalovibrio reitneri TaxID=1307759 RepID=UPI0004A72E5B|nr:acetyl-CoA carboxylase biotin carboxylase subunit family protein [Desulfohalovibrio reitneri]
MSARKHKVLVANRGEIAIRIINACRKLGLEFVCVYTAEDRHSGHVTHAVKHGGDKAAYQVASYHDANELLAVADHSGATAVHPGYGFFAEDFRFARRVVRRDRPLLWIGPSWRVIRELGDKINTKRLARRIGVPTVPGSDRPVYDEMEAEEIAESLFAFQAEQGLEDAVVLLKASAGGGGMGIEEIDRMDLFRSVYRRLRNYAKRQFHDSGVLIEQRIFDFNHLEVQVLGEATGQRHVHFGTRNCSIQSTGRQKRVEVAPGFAPDELAYAFDAGRVLEDITRHSLNLAAEVGYNSVGTWEWIVTPKGEPFLMEVNTRIQVENGISGAISAIKGEGPVDLIKEQVRVALGEPLGYGQEDIGFNGVSIEYRLIAEDPDNRFTPWVGTINRFDWRDAPWLSVLTHVPRDREYVIPTEFDPNLALAIVRGDDLEQAKKRGREFLDSLVLEGRDESGGSLRSNVAFLREKTEHLLEF